MGPISAYKNLKDQAQQPQQPGATDPRDVMMDGWGFTAEQSRRNKAEAQTMPQIDTSDPINSLAGMLVTPAEREAQQQKLMENKRKMLLWTGLFDGLRNLGNLYSVSKGARPQQYTDNPYKTIEMGYQQEMKNLDDVYKNRQAYAQQLYNWQRMGEQDQMRREAHDAQNKYLKAREDALREESRRKDEYNLARTKYYEAVASKNDEQAEYWRLRAQGVPQESAAKIAKDNALAAKANRTGGSGSRSGNQGYETIVTEGYDEKGNKVKKTVKQPRQSPKSTRSSSDDKVKNAGSSGVDSNVLRGFSMRRR